MTLKIGYPRKYQTDSKGNPLNVCCYYFVNIEELNPLKQDCSETQRTQVEEKKKEPFLHIIEEDQCNFSATGMIYGGEN